MIRPRFISFRVLRHRGLGFRGLGLLLCHLRGVQRFEDAVSDEFFNDLRGLRGFELAQLEHFVDAAMSIDRLQHFFDVLRHIAHFRFGAGFEFQYDRPCLSRRLLASVVDGGHHPGVCCLPESNFPCSHSPCVPAQGSTWMR